MRDYVAALPAPRDRNKTLTALAEPVTAPHDGGALFPDDSGARKSGHATAYVSRQYLGSRGQVGNGIVTATTARARAKGIAFRALVADCFYGPNENPHFIAELDRAATPHVAAVEPRKNCPLPPADMAGIVILYGLRGWTEQEDKPVEHELDWADFKVRSGQAIQREPPVVSDPPSSDHNRLADTRSRPVRLRGIRQPVQPRTRQPGHRPGQGHRDQPLVVTLTNNPVAANRRRTVTECEPRPVS
nr:transposase [Streptomyces inhibens]